MITEIHESFLRLIRLGISHVENIEILRLSEADWKVLQALAYEQGLSAIVLDGVGKLPLSSYNMPDMFKKEWIGEVLQDEVTYAIQQKVAAEMAILFHQNAIRTYVLKGAVVSECYPIPEHRYSVDMDCFLLSVGNGEDAWEIGNSVIERKGYEVERDFYKNSTFYLPDLMVENHKFLTPFRGNKRLKALEKVLQALLKQDNGEDLFEGTRLYRPPVMVSALFLIEHAYSHFLHEGLTWRHVLDWMMFSEKYKDELNWSEFHAYVDEFGFGKFYNAYMQLGYFLLGHLKEENLSKEEQKMLADVWAPLDLHETVRGAKGKLALVGNTWRARWKYRYFTEMSWVTALWIQVRGYLFEKRPSLDS